MRHHALSAVVPRFTCLSWNVHRARGNDGVVDPQRTLDTLMQEAWREGTDALCLQEADEEKPPYSRIFDGQEIERLTGLRSAHNDAKSRYSSESTGFLGTLVFLHPNIAVEDVRLLDLPGVYPRGAVVVDAVKDGVAFRLIATHLSLSQVLRLAQMRTIGQHLTRSATRPAVLVGDLNEWRPWNGLAFASRFIGHSFSGPAPASFPIIRPFLPLDRVMVSGAAHIESVQVLDGPGIRATSDHRPIYGTVHLAT